MMMYEGNNLTDREMDLFCEVLYDTEDAILELIEAKGLKMGVVFYEGYTIVYEIDSEGDVSIEHITETISTEGIEDAE